MKARLDHPVFVTLAACGTFAFLATVHGKTESDKAASDAYKKVITEKIGPIWYRHAQASNPKSIPVGTVVISFRITSKGQVKNLRVVSNTSNQKWADIAVRSIREAKFPPIPKDVLRGHDGIDVDKVNFKNFDK